LAECRRGRFVSFDDSISVLLQQGVEEMIYERGQVPRHVEGLRHLLRLIFIRHEVPAVQLVHDGARKRVCHPGKAAYPGNGRLKNGIVRYLGFHQLGNRGIVVVRADGVAHSGDEAFLVARGAEEPAECFQRGQCLSVSDELPVCALGRIRVEVPQGVPRLVDVREQQPHEVEEVSQRAVALSRWNHIQAFVRFHKLDLRPPDIIHGHYEAQDRYP